ncbi:MAG: hypothetical protein LBV49_09835 [Azonexus sp.]|jgi:hypothetical protein|nr:hypothetical protein [Azonexus sp.]
MKTNATMLPVSGRLPEDLYQWLASLPLDGATTFSDKLREAIAMLKRRHDGGVDYVEALAMHRDLARPARDRLAAIEHDCGAHSEVLATLFEHIPAIGAALQSARLEKPEDARALEAQLTRRALQLAETLLRQMLTTEAAAYDPLVVRHNAQRLVELAQRISLSPSSQGGAS